MNESQAEATIEVFTQSHCASCRQVEKFLRERGVDFAVRDVEAEPDALEEIAARGYMSTPVIRVGDQWIAGFQRAHLEKLLRTFGEA